MKILYFTSTGNSLQVAKTLGGELVSIPQEISKNTEIYEDDVVGIIFPTYCFSLPKIVEKFLKKIKIKADYKFAIGTYGSMSGKVMSDAQKLAKRNGYEFDYVDSILMVDNYLPLFDISKQVEKIPSKKIDENLERIKINIEQRVVQKDLKYNLGIDILHFIMKNISGFVEPDDFSKNFIVNDNCVKCGICAKVCPVNNISVNDKVVFDRHCEGCLGCINACPKKAIHLKNERSSVRWQNPQVTLDEIINSNNVQK